MNDVNSPAATHSLRNSNIFFTLAINSNHSQNIIFIRRIQSTESDRLVSTGRDKNNGQRIRQEADIEHEQMLVIQRVDVGYTGP